MKIAHGLAWVMSGVGWLIGCDGELPLFERPLPAAAGESTGGASQGTGNTGGSFAGGLEPPRGGVENAAGSQAAGGRRPGMIDDLEDGNLRAEGFGWWYPTNDFTSTQGWGAEPVTDREGSKLAARTHGVGFTDWGAIFGVTLDDAGPLDASEYTELWFWARAQPGAVPQMWAQLVDHREQPYGFQVELTERWTEYRVPFTSLQASEGGSIDTTQLLAVQFFFPPQQPFDVWFDDVAFGQ